MVDAPAIPANVNLAKRKPTAVAAYSRRVKSIATNAQQFGESTFVNITLDTSTPGAFNDNLSSYLKFDLTFSNPNPYIDFVSFGSAGAASVIEEFRIYCQGTPIEEILQYNTCFQLFMDLNAQCKDPYYMYRPSKITQGVKYSQHVNQIKPPMVNRAGNPMHYNALLSNYRSTATVYDTAYNWTNLLTSDSIGWTKISFMGSTYNLTASNGGFQFAINPASFTVGNQSFAGGGVGAMYGDSTQLNAAGVAALTYATNTGNNSNCAVHAGINALVDFSSGNQFGPAQVTDKNENVYTNATTSTQITGVPPSVPFFASASYFFTNPDYEPHNPLNWPMIMPNDTYQSDNQNNDQGPDNIQDYFMFLSNVKLIPVGIKGSARASNSTAANAGTITGSYNYSSLNFSNVTQLASTASSTTTITVCIPLLSGFLGSLSEKMSPFMLMAPGSTYIQLKTATALKAFQVSMDPCRRVLGTLRDYVPFMGSIGGTYGQFNYLNGWYYGGTNTTANLPKAWLTNLSYLQAGTSNYLYQPAGTPIAMNSFMGPIAKAVVEAGTTGAFDDINLAFVAARQQLGGSFACIGGNLLPLMTYLNTATSYGNTVGNASNSLITTSSKNYQLMFQPYSVAAMEGFWSTIEADDQWASLFNAGFGYYTGITPYSQASCSGITATGAGVFSNSLSAVPGAYVEPLAGNNLVTYFLGQVNTYGTTTSETQYNQVGGPVPTPTCNGIGVYNNQQQSFFLRPAGVPLPQYMLVTTPWSLKTLLGSATTAGSVTSGPWQVIGDQILPSSLASESYACYGTYLERSRQQSMRVFSGGSGTTFGSTGGSTSITTTSNGTTGGYLTYYLSNVEFVGQQVILPDAVTTRILASAQAGDISTEANSVRTYQSPVQATYTTQNILLPCKIASANALYCVFQPSNYTTGGLDTQLYESTSRMCPFSTIYSSATTGISSTTSGQSTIGLSSPFTIVNPSAKSGGFEIQLKIGNELIPQQPMTSISEIVAENVKAQHKLFDVVSNMNCTFSFSTSSGFTGTSTGTSTNVTSYDNSSDTTNGLFYDCLKDNDFCSAFTFAPYLDDQTFINNPNWNYIAMCASQYINGLNSTSAQYSTCLASTLYGTRNAFVLPIFQPISSTFFIGFDMDTWSRQSSVARSGKYLGNNQITLYMTNCVAFNSNATGLTGVNLYTFVLHDVRYSFQAGGSVVAYY